MCFSSKVKTPKVSSDIPAPEPVLLETPKGVEYGDGSASGDENDTDNPARVDLDDTTSGSVGSALDKPKGTIKNSTSYSTSAIKKSLGARTKTR
ncbi:putative phage head protein [Pseudomonas sp. B14(2017)]|uniref:putative phage head protein n=1 Tax=Pseudomonas sp. B14(2017) TaxID=1981745 RepID=UPI00117B114A|nr:putative phage head protein [Pseudomonas sp. B14(2017)]